MAKANFKEWRDRLTGELEFMPDTIHDIREAATNLKKVSYELADVSKMLKQIVTTLNATGFTDALKRAEDAAVRVSAIEKAMSDAGDTLKSSISKLPGGKLLTRSSDDD